MLLKLLKMIPNQFKKREKDFSSNHTQVSISMIKFAFYLDTAINNEMMNDFHSYSSSCLA